MGSNLDALYTFENLMDGIRLSGNYEFMITPSVTYFSLLSSEDADNVKSSSECEDSYVLSEMNATTEKEYRQSAIGIITDLDNLGCFRDISE